MPKSSKTYQDLFEENTLLKQRIRELEQAGADHQRVKDDLMHQSDSAYNVLFTSAPEGILLIDVETKQLVQTNPALCRMYGYTQDEMLSLCLKDIHPVESFEHVLAEFDAAAQGVRPSATDIPCLRRDGSIFYADISVAPIILSDRRCNLCYVTDITGRRQQQESLLLFKALVDHSTDAIGIATPEGSHYYQNETFDRLFGDVRGQLPECLYVDKAVVRQFLDGVATDGIWQGEVEMVRKDGEILDIFLRAYAIRSLDGRIVGIVGQHTDISERRQAQESLQLFKALVDRATDAIGMSTAEGSHYYQNEAFDRLFGDIGDYPPESLYVDPSLGRQVWDTIMAGGNWQGEARMFGQDRTILDILVRAYAIHNESGRIIGLASLNTDITESKRAEEALRLSEEKFLKAFNANPGMMTITTLEEGRFVDANESSLRTLGFSREEIIGRNSVESGIVLPEDRTAMRSAFDQDNCLRDFPLSVRTKAGEVRDCLVSGEVIDFAGQKHFLLLMSDITERKRAEAALRLSEEKFLKAFNANPGMMAISTLEEGRFVEVNETLVRTLGFTREEVIGRSSVELSILSPEARRAMRDAFVQNGFLRDFPMPLRTKTGDVRDCLVAGEMIELAGQKHFLILMNDISERKRAEEALRTSEEKFLKAFNANPAMISISTLADGRLIDVNDCFVEILGYAREEVIGRTSVELGIVTVEMRDAGIRLFEAAGPMRNYPSLIRTKKGEWRDCLTSSEIIEIGGEKCLLLSTNDITERKRVEEELEAWKRRYDLIVAASGQVAYEYTVATGEIVWGTSFEKVLGFTAEEMNGGLAQWEDLLHPEDKETVMSALDATAQAVGEWDVEYRMRHKRGDYVWIRDRGFFLPDADGQPYCQFGMMEDITERKLAVEALRDREQMLSQIINNMPGRVSRVDRHLRYIFINREYEEGYGIPADQMLGHTIAEVFGDELFQQWLPYADKVFSGQSVTFETRTKKPSGEPVCGLVKLIPDLEPGGTVRGFFIVVIDITELKQIEQTLRESRRQLMEAQQIAHIGRWEIDLLTEKITWSDEIFRIFEKDSRSFVPTYEDFMEAVHPDDREPLVSSLTQAMDNHRPCNVTHRLLLPDGRIKYLHEQGETFYGAEGQPLRTVGVTQDITELKQAEEEKKNLAIQLTQSQKMESVGRLAGGVAHDFNNMLSVIIGSAQLAMTKLLPMDPLYKPLNDILNAGMRSADLTRQLLAFARKQTINPKVLDLNDTIAGMLKILRRLIGENIKLIWIPGEKLWQVKMDPSQVDQLLANLTVNARDAIDKAGKIVIETSNTVCDKTYCAAHPECTPGEYVLLTVSDDGCGMDRETLANIFEPFFTTKKEGQGTGLGLPTVYGIVKQNSGFINVYSEPGLGTAFRIYLPHYEDVQQEPTEDRTTATIQGGTETVLIVEDESAVLELSQDMLETLGYKVLTAKGAQQALQLVRTYDGTIDLLLIDVVMPDMNGKELSEKIVAIKPGLKRLYMSGYTADVIARQGILEEGVQLISKPFFLNDLAAKVREVLGS